MGGGSLAGRGVEGGGGIKAMDSLDPVYFLHLGRVFYIENPGRLAL